MQLKSFSVSNFRSVKDSGDVPIDKVTCLVGKNESGKTALLKALYRLNPISNDDSVFRVTDDYPRAEVDEYEYDVEKGTVKPAIVISAVFEFSEDDLTNLLDDFPREVLVGSTVTISKGYTGRTYVDLKVSETIAVEHLAAKYLPSDLAKKAGKSETLSELSSVVSGFEDDDNSESFQSLLSLLQEISKAECFSIYLYSKYVKAYVPKFLYFDEYYQMKGQDNLDGLKERRDSKTLYESDRPLLGLLKHARIDLDKALASKETQELKNKLEGAGNRLTRNLLKYWSQNKHLEIRFDIREAKEEDPEGMQEGVNLWAEIYDRKHFATTPMGRRSRGFVWFFSFLAYFGQQKEERKCPLILLLDEPGLSLHANAQADLLRYIEKELKPSHQVIYSTHSPFMVDPMNLESVRLVEDNSAEVDIADSAENEGTKVSRNVLEVTRDTLFPLQGALGYNIHQTLFIGPNTLVVEGPSDLLYLQAMSSVLERINRTGLSSKWTITPCGGAGKLPAFVSMIGSQKDMNVVVLMDIDPNTNEIARDLIAQKILKKGKIISYADILKVKEADVEDMFDRDLYLYMFSKEFRRRLNKKDLNENIPRTVKMIENAMNGDKYNHYRVSRYFTENLTELEKRISDTELQRFEELFQRLNEQL